MGVYTGYLNSQWDFGQIAEERKKILTEISKLRGGRDILVIASDISKSDVRVQIDYTDILAVQDQLSAMTQREIDVILETPGGLAEVVEDIVRMIRAKYERVAIIVPGYAKSAGTIFAMAGDEILMGPTSALGPVDAQILFQGKRFSADAFLKGLDEIKGEVERRGKLNIAYVPILQGISPGEIQHCENAQDLSKQLVTQWLENYKFKYWEKHSSNSLPVTPDERHVRAEEIAKELCSQTKWKTHNRSIKLKDLEDLRIKITDYSQNPQLNELIMKYYALLRMTFESTNIYKIFETKKSQIYRFLGVSQGTPKVPSTEDFNSALIGFECPKCHAQYKIQANLKPGIPLERDCLLYPITNDIFTCPQCNTQNNLSSLRLQLEAQTGKKVV
jgi:Zn ribbon nucleic-acid-binding protein